MSTYSVSSRLVHLLGNQPKMFFGVARTGFKSGFQNIQSISPKSVQINVGIVLVQNHLGAAPVLFELTIPGAKGDQQHAPARHFIQRNSSRRIVLF
jgi:hypothetical protein